MKMLSKFVVSIAVMLAIFCCKPAEKKSDNILVYTSIFPIYNLTKHIAGGKCDVRLLLPPAVEIHTFEPKPNDLTNLNKADVFIFNSRYLEVWAEKFISGLDNKNMLILEAGNNITLEKLTDKKDSHTDSEHNVDPHIWLDFSNAEKIADNITSALCSKDTANCDFFKKNADNLKLKLKNLDAKFSDTLSKCKQNSIVSGGHFTFGYMAKRYKLDYYSASGLSPDAEPKPRDIAMIIKLLKSKGIKYIFYEEILTPRMSEMIASETGAKMLKLNSAHNLTPDEFKAGVDFFGLMEQNLANLKTGLECE